LKFTGEQETGNLYT